MLGLGHRSNGVDDHLVGPDGVAGEVRKPAPAVGGVERVDIEGGREKAAPSEPVGTWYARRQDQHDLKETEARTWGRPDPSHKRWQAPTLQDYPVAATKAW